MLKIKSIFLFVLTTLLIISCEKENLNTSDSLIFGVFYGFCEGEKCIETFQLEGNALYEDTKDQYRALTGFNFVQLSNVQYNLAKDLYDNVPPALWNESNEKVFGCPDCYDQGGYLVQQQKDGITKSWIIDKTQKDVPNYLHAFLDSITNKIQLINQ